MSVKVAMAARKWSIEAIEPTKVASDSRQKRSSLNWKSGPHKNSPDAITSHALAIDEMCPGKPRLEPPAGR